MTTINDICQFMNQLAPHELAEDWDNVGLLVGDPLISVQRVMTCLTITPESAAEAIEGRAGLVVTHHPLPFRPMQRLTSDQTPGRLLLDLIRADVAVYSAHTAFDSAANGINQRLAAKFGLQDIRALVPAAVDNPNLGAARVARAGEAMKLADLLSLAKHEFALPSIQYVGDLQQSVSRVAFACGSGGSFLPAAIQAGCDTFVTGETNFHTCLEASARSVGLVLLGHFASERFALEGLADLIAQEFSLEEIWASRRESDPIQAG